MKLLCACLRNLRPVKRSMSLSTLTRLVRDVVAGTKFSLTVCVNGRYVQSWLEEDQIMPHISRDLRYWIENIP